MNEQNSLLQDLNHLVDQLKTIPHGKWIEKALNSLIRLSDQEVDRLDWKILSTTMEDMESAFSIFYNYRHIRKIAVFGSARTPSKHMEYQMATQFARHVTQQGFMVITGAGGGIMEAANAGAGKENSFGLNIQLPYEQEANPFIDDDPKLMRFKYFFTRKLFFLKESDAITLFPGGFGTHDEALECLTLCQTGRYGPVPIVLIDKPGGTYWQDWNNYIHQNLVKNRLINPEDTSFYTITDNLDIAYETICNFYRMYHSSRYVQGRLVIRLQQSLSDQDLELLNQDFADILSSGQITRTAALDQEQDQTPKDLPRLLLNFNQRNFGRLYQMIGTINQMGLGLGCNFQPQNK